MNRSRLAWLCLCGLFAVLPGRAQTATPMSLDLSGALNYDAVGTSDEINWVDATYTNGNRRLTDKLGGHNLANAGLALTNTDSLSAGTALPRYGVVGNFIDSFAYEVQSGTAYVSSPNSVHLIATATSSTTVSASATITLNSVQQLNYNNLNILFVQNRTAGAGTFRTTVTATYSDGTTTLLDTGSVTVAANAVGGTFGSAGVSGQGGLTNDTDSSATVTNVFSSPYGVTTSGAPGSETSIVSSTASTNLWELTTPITLNSAKVLASVTVQVQAAQSGQWNELTIFGMCATPTYYKAPPAADPAATLNVTFNPGRLAAHPRLMMTPSTIQSLKNFYNSAAGQVWAAQNFTQYVQDFNVPVNTAFLTDATEAQRQGLWRLPTAALYYVITGDETAFNKAVGFLQLYVSLPDWETSTERNSGMAAANNMIGVALAYDWLYNDLDPTFRETVREKLFTQARALYYGGFLQYNSNIAAVYWQLDPLTNQRWHRDAGLALAVMASYTGDPSQNWLMNQTASEMAFVDNWLPADGSSHESVAYETFGATHLTLAMEASDDCLGTNLLDANWFKNVGNFHLQMDLSSFNNVLDFGDFSGTDQGSYNNFMLKTAAHFQNADLRDGVLALFSQQPGALDFGWFSLLWDDPTLTGGNYENLPLTGYYSDLGLSTFRDSWTTDNAVTAMFKCSPLGGISLNQYRDANNETYVNVAHDDPDANSFVLFSGDDTLASTDQYSQHKTARQQNTVLVNGAGQMPTGRTEPQVFSQPATSGSMLPMATAFPPVPLGSATVMEGEASGSYPAITGTSGRPAISRYRRLFVWSPSKYILVLDDLRSAQSVNFTWQVQGSGVTTNNVSAGLFTLTGGSHSCGFQVIGSEPLTFATVASTADNKSTSLDYQQLQATAAGTELQVASLFNPWQQSNLSVALSNASASGCNVQVTGNGISDLYRWTYATSSSTPSSLINAAPAIISNPPTDTGVAGTLYSFLLMATGWPNPTFTLTAGSLPPGVVLLPNGTLSGVPTKPGTYTGTITVSNGSGPPVSQNFSITVTTNYISWAGEYLSTAQMSEPTVSGTTATPGNDGVTNSMKYALALNPLTTYNPGDPALPSVQTATVGQSQYLSLTFDGEATDMTYQVQVTSDLTTPIQWTTIYTSTAGIAPGPMTVQDIQAITNPTGNRYMRLLVTPVTP